MSDNGALSLYDLDSERNVIRRLCTDSDFCSQIFINQLLIVEHFSDLFHRDAFSTIQSYYKQFGSLPDVHKFRSHLESHITLSQAFKDRKQQAGIWKASSEKLFISLSEDEKKSSKADMAMLEEHRRGRLLQRTITSAFESFEDFNFDEAFGSMSSALLDARIDENRIMEGDVVGDWTQHLQYMELQRSGVIQPVPSGLFGAKEDETGNAEIVRIDDIIYGGYYPGELVVVIGETKLGKSFWLMENAFQAALAGKNVLAFTIEMDKMKWQRRFYSRLTGLPYKLFRTATLSKKQEEFVQRRLEAWKAKCGLLYVVSFDKGADCNDIDSKANQTQDLFGLEWDELAIDYLNDMRPVDRRLNPKSWEAMGEISWGLTSLAKSFNSHKGLSVITANQKRGDKAGKSRTNWDDAAYGKMISQHASFIFGLGADDEDRRLKRIRFDYSQGRDGEAGIHLYLYHNLAVSRISSLKRLREYYGMDND